MQPDTLTYGRELETVTRKRWRGLLRWFLRFAIATLVLIVLCHTAWLLWATHRLDSAIAELKAAGEPVSAGDLQPTVPPAEQNAQTDIAAAAAILSASSIASDRMDGLDDTPQAPLISLERTRLRAYIDRYRAALPLLDSAASKPFNVITTPMKTPLLNVMLTPMNGLRSAALFAGYDAELEHDAGRDDLAYRRLRQIEPIARGAGGNPVLVGYLVGVGIRNLEASHCVSIAPALRIGGGPGEVANRDVREWIAALLDQQTIDAEMHAAYQGERVMQIEMMQAADDGGISFQQLAGGGAAAKTPMPVRYFVRPFVRWNAANCIQTTTGILNVLGTRDWPTLRARPELNTRRTGASYVLNIVEQLMSNSLARAIETRYRLQIDRSLAAVALASRLCEIETGHRPASWDALVPRYLPTIPRDVLASDKPMQARFGGADPIVWSVGSNGVDDGGDSTVTGKYPSEWNRRDRILHLTQQQREFSSDEQVLIALDLDSPVRATPPAATQPAAPPAADAPALAGGLPDWNYIDAFDISGDTAAFPGLQTRRDVLKSLMEPVDAPEPATAPAPATAIQHLKGWAQFASGTWTFDLRSDGFVNIIAPDGQVLMSHWRALPEQTSVRGVLR